MSNIQIFQNQDFGEIRTISQNSTAYFCLIDVCRILEINNPRQAKTRLKEGGVISNDVIDNLGRTQTTTFIDESNLYKLVFQSRKPEAERFTDWVTSEVLPSIRKHGAYMSEETLEEALLNPDFLVKLATELKAEKEARRKAEAEIEQNRSKVLFADAVSGSKDGMLIHLLAKFLNQNGYKTGQNRLFATLREKGFLMRTGEGHNVPTQKAIDLGLFKVKERVISTPDGEPRLTLTTLVTAKGQQYFVNYFLGKTKALVPT